MKIAIFAVALAALPAAAGATTLVDGSFEAKGAWTPIVDYCYDGFSAAGRPICVASAWAGNGVIRSGAGAWGGTTTPAGQYYGFVQGASSLSQTFVATGNGTGSFTWLDTNRTNTGGLQSYNVLVSGGGSVIDLGLFTSATGAFVARESGNFSVVDGTTYTLTFAGLSGEDRTSFIDDVAITVTPVPEPAGWALLLTGFALVGLAARRRNTAVTA